jgi:hypothetical protein
MDSDDPACGENDDVRSKSKQGAGTFLPGPRISIAVSLMQKQLTQLDRLAVEIRASGGVWLTRSGIITALIEAAVRSDGVTERDSESLRDHEP